MVVCVAEQLPLAGVGIPIDAFYIQDLDLAAIDAILQDPQFVDILKASLLRTMKQQQKDPYRGRKRMALDRLLRVLVLKHVKRWSTPVLRKELERNLDYRTFTRYFDDKIPTVSTLTRNLARVDGQGLREMVAHLRKLAVQWGVIAGQKMRMDTTVCETNIHYPTDSGLLRDGIRVLQRAMGRAQQLVPSLGRLRDYSRAALHRVLEITRAANSRSEAGQQRMKRSYRALMKITGVVVRAAQVVEDKLGDKTTTQHLSLIEHKAAAGLKDELQTKRPLVDNVLRQTKARIYRGDTKYPGKTLSLFEPQTAAIRKGKPQKPTEFGSLVALYEVEHGFISDYERLAANPADVTLMVPALQRHRQNFGYAPRAVATDRGFWSKDNEDKAKALGVKQVSVPYRGVLSTFRAQLQRRRWFRRLQKWRAGGEGRIGILKHQYGLNRCLYKKERGMDRWVGSCVLANNLVVTARALRTKADRDRQSAAQA